MSQTSRDLLAAARRNVRELTPHQVQESVGRVLIDVREQDEWDQGYIPGAVHLSKGYIELRIEDTVPDRSTPITLYCAAGIRSLLAARALGEMGYQDVASMSGGFGGWKDAGLHFTVPRALTAEQKLRYSRHLLMPEIGEEGQGKLLDAKVLMIGTGGLGSPAALYLAAAGVGTIGLVDFDTVDVSNLQRQILHAQDRIGMAKTQSAKIALTALNPDVRVVEHNEVLNSESAPRLFRFEGQVSTIVPFASPCYRCRYPAPPPPEEAPSCAEAGVLGVLPGIVGVLQAAEVIKLILGIGQPLTGRLLAIDALDMRFREFRVPRDPECPVCGENPTITEPIDYEGFCAVPLTRPAAAPPTAVAAR